MSGARIRRDVRKRNRYARHQILTPSVVTTPDPLEGENHDRRDPNLVA